MHIDSWIKDLSGSPKMIPFDRPAMTCFCNYGPIWCCFWNTA